MQRSPTMRAMALALAAGLALAALPGRGEPSAPAARTNAVVNPFEGGPVAAPACAIDKAVFRNLERLGILPASLCSDEVFVRRVYLDTTGALPTVEEARAFLADERPDKRHALIDRLLARDAFADYWSLKWCDLLRVKSEFPINLWPNAVQAYHRWILASLRQNLPYDRFVRELLTTSGSNFHDPQVNFYRAVQNKEPPALAQAVALTFMGVRADRWPEARRNAMAAFFSQVGYKATSEWKEEIVYFDISKASNAVLQTTFPDGKPVRIAAGQDPREVFADWLVDVRNPWFARNIVNRVWFWLLGRGAAGDPDDLREDVPPANPELLALLEKELVADRYDLRQLFRSILQSQTYQLSCLPRSRDPRAEAAFAYYPVRRLEAEVLIDAIDQITGSAENYSSIIPEPYTFIPEDQNTVVLADASISSPFLDLFGRSPRDSGLEAERNSRPTAAQCLHLLNSSNIQRKLEQGARLRILLQAQKKPREIVDDLYLAILSRYPTEEERKTVAAYRQANPTRRPGIDLAWTLINSAEFQYRH